MNYLSYISCSQYYIIFLLNHDLKDFQKLSIDYFITFNINQSVYRYSKGDLSYVNLIFLINIILLFTIKFGVYYCYRGAYNAICILKLEQSFDIHVNT